MKTRPQGVNGQCHLSHASVKPETTPLKNQTYRCATMSTDPIITKMFRVTILFVGVELDNDVLLSLSISKHQQTGLSNLAQL